MTARKTVTGWVGATLALALAGCSGSPVRGPSSSESESAAAASVCRADRIPGLAEAAAAEARFSALVQHGKPDDVLLDPVRNQAARNAFDTAKSLVLALIDELAGKKPSPLWNEMKERVRSAELRLSTRFTATSPPQYGAQSNPPENYVISGGIITLVDVAPDAVMLLFAHELGHFMDPIRYPVPLSGNADSPWAAVVRCLRQPTSAAARVGDPACYSKAAALFTQRKLPIIAAACSETADHLATNPDWASAGSSCGCDSPQGSEAFADWVAAEAMARRPAFSFSGALAWPCSAYVSQTYLYDQLRSAPGGEATVLAIRSMDVHPLMSTRIERIFLEQPALASQLGVRPDGEYCVFK